jgi:putative glycosyltransferase
MDPLMKFAEVMPGHRPKTISVVTSLYRSAPYVFEFYHRTKRAVERAGYASEFIFVDDGSPDNAAEHVGRLREGDDRVHLIRLSRNHGQQRAMLTGLQHARGDLVFALDVDLEEKPEDLATLLEAMRAQNADAAYGVMQARRGGFVKRLLGGMFHQMMTRIAATPIPENQLWSRVMTRRVVNAVCRFDEEHLYLGGIFHLVGFKQVAVPLEKLDKHSTTYGFWKRSLTALDALVSFSVAPLYALCAFGLLMIVVCALLATVIVVQKLVFGVSVPGWPTLAVLLLAFMGIVIFAQGLLGIYIGKIFAQVKNRPRCIIASSTLSPDEDGRSLTDEDLHVRV